eukprot:scaffold60274_cov27-Phaeocystis_antarctica.AAC.1
MEDEDKVWLAKEVYDRLDVPICWCTDLLAHNTWAMLRRYTLQAFARPPAPDLYSSMRATVRESGTRPPNCV